jgi:FAD/FMN-containing dehydrogenase
MEDFREALEGTGATISFDPQHRRAYDHDLGEMPAALLAQIRACPDVVAVPRSTAQVAAILAIAAHHRVPVTPRGQASSGYGGAIPTRGGLLLDLAALNGVLAVNAAARTVDVQPGVVWNDLSRRLRRSGLDLRICPTSAPSSTVGGWFAMGGVGIGSLRYGSIRDVVSEIDVAGLDGRIETVSGDAIELHHQTCGTLGVITRLRLACRPAEGVRSFAVHVPDADGIEALLGAVDRICPPYSVAFHSAGYLKMRADAAPDGHAEAPIASGFLAVVTLLESEAHEARVAIAASACGGSLLPRDLAEHEWEDRFYPMRIKKRGPALLAAEFVIPAARFGTAWREIEAKLSRDLLGAEAFAIRGGSVAVLAYLLDDPRDLLFPVRMAKAMIPVRVALRHGGSIYTPALWFASGTKRLFGAAKHEAVRSRKRLVDAHGLLNPGKLHAPRARWFPVGNLSALVAFGSALAAPLSRRLASRRRATTPSHREG